MTHEQQLQQELDPTTPAVAVEPKDKFPLMPDVFRFLLSSLEKINMPYASAEHDNETEPKAA